MEDGAKGLKMKAQRPGRPQDRARPLGRAGLGEAGGSVGEDGLAHPPRSQVGRRGRSQTAGEAGSPVSSGTAFATR